VCGFSRLALVPSNSTRYAKGSAVRNNIAVTAVITAIMVLIAGCQTKPVPSSELVKQPQAQAERTVWPLSERPIDDLNFMASCSGRNCLFRASGVWQSSTGKPGSELSDPISVNISWTFAFFKSSSNFASRRRMTEVYDPFGPDNMHKARPA
jgi:hypothetical protein